METMTYEVTGRIARITLNRPERGNGLTFTTPVELAACVERANLDPAVHVIGLAARRRCAGEEPRSGADVGSRRRLPDDVAQRSRLHEPVPQRQAGRVQG